MKPVEMRKTSLMKKKIYENNFTDRQATALIYQSLVTR